MTLLEYLGKEEPFHRRNKLDGLRSLIRNHFSEITQAREKGYSWCQIQKAMRDIWPNECFHSCPAERIYHEIQKGRTRDNT